MIQVSLVNEAVFNVGDIAQGVADFATRTRTRIAAQTVTPSAFGTISAGTDDVVVVFQNPIQSHLPAHAPAWLTHDTHVLPVVEQAADAQNLRPYLADRNALIRANFPAPAFNDVVLDEILTRALLRRQTRSVFISYQRQFTAGIARLLASELQSQGFTVFLDERSMHPAGYFNEEIGYRLNDVDLVILLVTQSTHLSKWVLKEVAFAHNAKIGLLGIVCDNQPTHPWIFALLDPAQIVSFGRAVTGNIATLTQSEFESVVARLRELRVANIMRRIEDLLPAAVDKLRLRHPGSKVVPGDRPGAFTVSGVPGQTQVLPFRPEAETLFELRRVTPSATDQVTVVHPENLPQDRRVQALKWLCLPVEQHMELWDVQKLWI